MGGLERETGEYTREGQDRVPELTSKSTSKWQELSRQAFQKMIARRFSVSNEFVDILDGKSSHYGEVSTVVK